MRSEKINEIKKQLRQGVPEGEIKESLKRKGYSIEEIDEAFKPHGYDMRSWYLFFGIVISLVGLYLYFTEKSLIIFMLGLLLFVAYYYEGKRLKRLKNMN